MAINQFHNDIQCSDRCVDIYYDSVKNNPSNEATYDYTYRRCMSVCVMAKELDYRYFIMKAFVKNMLP